MFNSIIADLPCSTLGSIATGEIQIKWQDATQRQLERYLEGDILPRILTEFDNAWVRTDYICNQCSKQTVGRDDLKFIRTMDQSRHVVFVRIERGRIARILSEVEFLRDVKSSFVSDIL